MPFASQSAKSALDNAESLSAMLHQETCNYTTADYLNHHSTSTDTVVITEHDRMKTVDWCYDIIDHCKLDRETVAIAMDIVDRFISNQSAYDAQRTLLCSWQYQLVVVSSLFIAVKLNERVIVESDFFASLCRGLYGIDEIEKMEMHILQGLTWRMNAPTSIQMVHYILSLVSSHVNQLDERVWTFILDEARYQTEHAVRDYYFSTQRSSTIAVASIVNAIEMLKKEDRTDLLTALLRVIQDFDFASVNEIAAARKRLLHNVEEMGVANECSIGGISISISGANCSEDIVKRYHCRGVAIQDCGNSNAIEMDTSPRTTCGTNQRYN